MTQRQQVIVDDPHAAPPESQASIARRIAQQGMPIDRRPTLARHRSNGMLGEVLQVARIPFLMAPIGTAPSWQFRTFRKQDYR